MRPIRLPWAMLALCTLGSGKTDPYTYLHHPVSTDIQAAQFAFDRGLTMVLAYEQDEGERAFREAARLDRSLAMAWWGIALAVGPNINYPQSAIAARSVGGRERDGQRRCRTGRPQRIQAAVAGR